MSSKLYIVGRPSWILLSLCVPVVTIFGHVMGRLGRQVQLYTIAIAHLLSATFASAGVALGDHPEMKLNAMDGTKIDLASYKGKMVLVDFWAGRARTSRDGEERLLDTYKHYADKGLVIIGINCDTKVTDAQGYIADLKITWPQYHEREGYRGGIAKDWGVSRLPMYYLIGPDGAVIWTGYKTGIEDIVADELLQHPPSLVNPDVLTKANCELDAVDKALAQGDRVTAITRFSQLSIDEAKKDPAFAQRRDKLAKQIDEAMNAMCAEVDAAVKAKQFARAVSEMREVAGAATGSQREAEIRKKLGDLQANPEVKAAAEQEAKEKEAAGALVEARKLRDDGDDVTAYIHFKAIAQDYPGTAAAQSASDTVKSYTLDAAFMQRFKDATVGAKARAVMNLADNYRTNGRKDLARENYEQVVKDYADTSYAIDAKKALDDLK